jgi:hypothetical protein
LIIGLVGTLPWEDSVLEAEHVSHDKHVNDLQRKEIIYIHEKILILKRQKALYIQ